MRGSIIFMVGDRNPFLVFLGDALKGQKIPVSTIVISGKIAAGEWAHFINRALAFFSIKESADFAEVFVILALHHPAMIFVFAEIFLVGLSQADPEMLGDALCITVFDLDDRVRAAIAWAFQAIIFFLLGHGETRFVFHLHNGLAILSQMEHIKNCGLRNFLREAATMSG